jgi:hypothetical protein
MPEKQGSSIRSSVRVRPGSCGRPGSRSPRWPVTWGSTRARWAAGSPGPGGAGRLTRDEHAELVALRRVAAAILPRGGVNASARSQGEGIGRYLCRSSR